MNSGNDRESLEPNKIAGLINRMVRMRQNVAARSRRRKVSEVVGGGPLQDGPQPKTKRRARNMEVGADTTDCDTGERKHFGAATEC